MPNILIGLLIMLFFIIMGVVLLNGRGGWFIPMYNVLPKKEQNTYNKKILFKGWGIWCLFASAAIGMAVVGKIVEKDWLENCSIISLLLSIVILGIWEFASKTLRKKEMCKSDSK